MTTNNNIKPPATIPAEIEKYNLLTKQEKQMLDNVGSCIIRLSQEDPVDINHMRQFWEYLADILYKERGTLIQRLSEVEKQKSDLEHFLIEHNQNSDEYFSILRLIGDAVQNRRVVKDILSFFTIAHENIGKTAGFLYKSQDRKYSPRSIKYGDQESNSETTKTKIKIETSEFGKSERIKKGR